MKTLTQALALTLLLGFSNLSVATPVGPGGGGPSTGGGSSCGIICRFIYGSCEIPSGDPDIPPLHDPFCLTRLRACIASCSGTGIGVIQLGYTGLADRHGWQWSPINPSDCTSPPIPSKN